MSLAAPFFLAAGISAALAVVALHFLARQRPRAVPFPTARFIPERPARAPSRAVRPSDLLLLAMRAGALVLLGTAFARPSLDRPRVGVRRVIVTAVPNWMPSLLEATDSVQALLRPGDLIAKVGPPPELAPRDRGPVTLSGDQLAARNSISTALVAAQREASSPTAAADSIELVLIAPFIRSQWDDATSAIRTLWPGRIRIVRIGAPPADSAIFPIDFRGATDDPLRTAGYAALRTIRPVRVVRGSLMPADSLWTARDDVLVHWPAQFASIADTSGAVALGDDVVVAPFPRPPAEAIRGEGRSAFWADGRRAAATHFLPIGGCVRDVGIPVPPRGDLVLRESFRRLVQGLLEPCVGARDARPLPDSLVNVLRGAGPLASGRAVARADDRPTLLVNLLLFGAAALLLLEPIARRRAA